MSGAYIRPPVPPTKLAAGYFTVYNNTDAADRLIGVQTGAGASSMLHTDTADGAMVAMTDGAVVPAHGTLVLSVGQRHLMIGRLFGPLKPGQDVAMELQFRTAGPIDVVAKVVPFGQPAPAAGNSTSSGAGK